MNLFTYQIELSVNVGVNHPLSFVNLLSAFINISASTLHMRKYPFFKKLLQIFIKKCNSKVSWANTSLQITKKKKKERKKKKRGGIKAPNKTKTMKYKQKEGEIFEKVRNGPQKIRK
ncbi:unnamed protein product [Pipistrellus nathusii]|uniref:Uncharacterized protein n=1 Tax=Pipistrellus nathusii TaxID=59473 RepID=A0ABN9ZRY8_PIPNA